MTSVVWLPYFDRILNYHCSKCSYALLICLNRLTISSLRSLITLFWSESSLVKTLINTFNSSKFAFLNRPDTMVSSPFDKLVCLVSRLLWSWIPCQIIKIRYAQNLLFCGEVKSICDIWLIVKDNCTLHFFSIKKPNFQDYLQDGRRGETEHFHAIKTPRRL